MWGCGLTLFHVFHSMIECVSATEYFSQKKGDIIVPTLFLGLFVPIFGLLGWWLLSPAPEVEVRACMYLCMYASLIHD